VVFEGPQSGSTPAGVRRMASRLQTLQVVGASFAFYTDEEIKRVSVVAITNPSTFDSHNLATAG
jgi:hypothetical protein